MYGILATCFVSKLSKFHPLFLDLVRTFLLLTTAGSRDFGELTSFHIISVNYNDIFL